MRTNLLLSALMLIAFKASSQFEYGTPLIDGSILYVVEETTEVYCDGKLRNKSELKANYSTNLTGISTWDDEDISQRKERKDKNAFLGSPIYMNNFTRTRKEGEEIDYTRPIQAPLHSVIANINTTAFGKEPCSIHYECTEEYVAVENEIGNYHGVVSHHGRPGVILKCQIMGMENCSKYLFFSIHSGGSWVELGKMEQSAVSGVTKILSRDDTGYDCKAYWKEEESKSIVVIESDLETGITDHALTGESGWIGKDGFFVRNRVEYEGDEVYSRTTEEITLMRIDTTEFFKYIREKPQSHTFKVSGSYRYVSTNIAGERTIINKRVSATFAIGKKPELSLEGENEQDFKEWIPGHEDYPEAFKPVKIKAKYAENGKQGKDSILFEIFNSSRLPGYCTNYPILPDNPPKEEPDLFFAPQDKQTDPNIKILNDTIAITTKKVQEAVIVVHSRDFGAHGTIRAWGITNVDKAVCSYDGKENMKIPFDMNENFIADKWEEDMGLKNVNYLDDKDNLPTGQATEGDGLTVFEEYRGFISEKDVEASGDKKHTLRNGKHVRTSPLCKDVFIVDNAGLFSKYYESPNPSETHWHYLNVEQVKLPPINEIIDAVKITEGDEAGPNDKSPEAVIARNNYLRYDQYIKSWEKKDYRRINANTPFDYRDNKQYAIYMVISPLTSTTGGATIGTGVKNPKSPLYTNHVVILPQYLTLQRRINEIFGGLKTNTTHPGYINRYTPDVLAKLTNTVYEAMVLHEIGHALGIPHHTKGSITILLPRTKEKHNIADANKGLNTDESTGDPLEICYADGENYLTTGIEGAFLAMGVTDCCMRYTIERETDFIEMKVLKPSVKYCKKGQSFIDGNGNKTDADACFSKIIIKCADVK